MVKFVGTANKGELKQGTAYFSYYNCYDQATRVNY
jgi:hypothetical protein